MTAPGGHRADTAGPASLRALLFARYPATQTFAAFLLALLATTALSLDPAAGSYHAIHAIDPAATGALYICYEVLLSFAGHTDALPLVALACLITVPVRAVFFGRRDSWRPAVVVPAALFALCMVFGASYDRTDSAALVFGGISQLIEATIGVIGWYLVAHVGIYLLYAAFTWFGGHRLPFTEGRYGRLWRAADLALNRHPFAVPLAVIVAAWLPTLVGTAPGLFMGDTGGQIRQWFNLPSGTSDYLDLIDPSVLLNGHHPVAHTALLGSCVELGMALWGDENAGFLLYTVLQFAVSAAALAYVVASLRLFGAGLIPRAVVLSFFAFMPLFSNYAVLATKDVLFGDAFVVLVVEMAKLLAPVPAPLGRTADASAGARGPGRGVRRRAGAGRAPARYAAAPAPAVLDVEASTATEFRLAVVPLAMPFRRRDWLLLLLSSLGCAFLRNGGIVFPLAALALAFAVRARGCRAGRIPAGRSGLVGMALVLAVTVASSVVFTAVVMPACKITPGSRRETLSIPFQQVARFVVKHDGAHAGIAGGTDDGLVKPEERAVIDAVLDYGTLARRYDPDKSDAVKNRFNERTTASELAAFFRVWAQLGARDPACYLSAVANNYFGYVYPSSKDVFTYSTASSEKLMARKRNRASFDFHRARNPVSTACDHLVTLYRVTVQRVPLLSLFLSSSTYVWLLLIACCYLVHTRRWRSLALFVPLLGVLGVCLIGPCNGATYMRYLYPMILALPFAVTVTLVWPRALAR